MTCPHLTVTVETPPDLVRTNDVGVDPVVTGDSFGLSISGDKPTCCAETVLRVGVIYNGNWQHDNLINFDATVG